MRKTKWLLAALTVLLFTSTALATGDSTSYLTLKDTIFLSVGPDSEKIFEHRVERKQTLFSLARFYGLSVEELYYYNSGLRDGVLSVGQSIRVPIPNRAIVRYRDAQFQINKMVPVYYVVRKGDTMFRICRYLFRMPVDTVLRRNNLAAPQIKPGQALHVGWMNIKGIPESFHQFTVDPTTRRNQAMRKVYLRTTGQHKVLNQQGAAFWQHNSKEDLDFYALHRQAPLHSVIEVTNPMNQRTVYVKVIGRIPDRNFGDEVVVVLSPISAKALGAKDPRFFVRVTYSK